SGWQNINMRVSQVANGPAANVGNLTFSGYEGRELVFNHFYQTSQQQGNVVRPPLCFPHYKTVTELTDANVWPFWGTDVFGFQYLYGKAQEEKDYLTYLQDSWNKTI